MVGLVAFGCTTSSDPVSIRGQADILDQIEQDPLKAKELCSQLKESTQREFCIEFALQALPKDELQVTKSLCDTLEGVSKGECWFQVAERSLLMSDCERAIPFVAECSLHLTLSALLRSEPTTWVEVEQIAKEFMVDGASTEHELMLYQYWFRNVSKLQVATCLDMTNPTVCRRALITQYLQRLKEWDMDPKSSCDVLPHKIAHGDQSALKEPFEAVVKKKCGAL
jgi:hypothetical protein